jgi:Fic family protein
MEIYNPIYETDGTISRLIGEIESLESIILAEPHYREYLYQCAPVWKVESIQSACAIQKWGLSPDEVLSCMREHPSEGIPPAKAQRIRNYAELLDHICRKSPGLEFSYKDLQTIHYDLQNGVGGDGIFDKRGQFRTRFVAVYHSHGNGVKYVPPSPTDLMPHLESFFNWLNDWHQNGGSPFVRAAVSHHRLLELRPFPQDNGKTCRLFFRRLLVSNKYPWRSFLPYETLFAKDRLKYYRLMDDYEKKHKNFLERRNPRLTRWIVYHLEGIRQLLNGFVNQLISQPRSQKIVRSLNRRQKRAMRYVKDHGRISNREYRRVCSVGRYMAYMELRDLAAKGYLEVIGDRGRSVIYQLPSI